jgi:DNA-binding MarR family transcriptional regulator
MLPPWKHSHYKSRMTNPPRDKVSNGSGMSQALELRKAVSALLRVFLVNEKQFPVAGTHERYSPHDFQTLDFLARNPGCKPAELCAFLGIVPTTGAAVLDRLERRGLLKRTRHETDRRARALSLTSQGEDFHDAIVKQDLLNMEAMLSILEPNERAPFVAMMIRIAGRLSNAQEVS